VIASTTADHAYDFEPPPKTNSNISIAATANAMGHERSQPEPARTAAGFRRGCTNVGECPHWASIPSFNFRTNDAGTGGAS
jgi:hypothetical protein